MKVLFDQNVPRNLRRHLTAHDVTRSFELGWQELRNGDLLDVAQSNGFEVLVTADANLAYQQNLRNRRISIVILPSGNWPEVEARIADVIRAIVESKPGTFEDLKLDRKQRSSSKPRPT